MYSDHSSSLFFRTNIDLIWFSDSERIRLLNAVRCQCSESTRRTNTQTTRVLTRSVCLQYPLNTWHCITTTSSRWPNFKPAKQGFLRGETYWNAWESLAHKAKSPMHCTAHCCSQYRTVQVSGDSEKLGLSLVYVWNWGCGALPRIPEEHK